MAPIENLVQRLHAKRRGKGWEANCPCHEDRKPSLSLSEGADRRALVNCFAGCATADILAAIGLTMRDLFPASSLGNGVATTKVWSPPPFDFQKKCGATMNGKDLIRLGNEWWFSRAFCSWLHENHYVGIFRGDFAFPVQDNGSVVAAHYRAKAAQVGEKDSWYYFPTGVNTRPLVIGDLAKAKQLHIGESQWDMLALADRTALYLNEHHVFVATRGAGNAALRKDLIPEGVSILVWAQNDEAGQTWLHQVVKCLPAPIGKAVVPSQFKDLNDWTKAGASVEDLYLAMFKNELVEKPLVAEPVQSESTDANADEETLQRLAALPPLEYERVRQAEAEKLGCRRVSILDRLVNAKRRPPPSRRTAIFKAER